MCKGVNIIEECFKKIKKIEDDKKLENYNYDACIENTVKGVKHSETVYNKKICDNNKDKYILLDRKMIDGCEVCDIYDKVNNTFYHNKKRDDLRTLGVQTIIGVLILKDKDKREEYLKELKRNNIDITQINTDNFKFAVGIIKKKTEKINYKDRLTLGLVYNQLELLGVELYIDEIEVIYNTNEEKKEKNRKKRKSK